MSMLRRQRIIDLFLPAQFLEGIENQPLRKRSALQLLHEHAGKAELVRLRVPRRHEGRGITKLFSSRRRLIDIYGHDARLVLLGDHQDASLAWPSASSRGLYLALTAAS